MRTLVAMSIAFLVGTTSPASAAVVLYTDPAGDGVVLGSALPPQVDLIEGTLAETDEALVVGWRLLDVPDGTAGLPMAQRLDFEFSLDDPDGVADPVSFGVRVETTRTGTTGYLDGNCTPGPPVSCTPVPGAVVATSVDPASDTFTAVVRRRDLRAGSVGVAVDGAVLTEAVLYRGIASYLGVPAVVVTHNLSDQADIPAPYVLGSAA